jgi:hypothetical protein
MVVKIEMRQYLGNITKVQFDSNDHHKTAFLRAVVRAITLDDNIVNARRLQDDNHDRRYLKVISHSSSSSSSGSSSINNLYSSLWADSIVISNNPNTQGIGLSYIITIDSVAPFDIAYLSNVITVDLQKALDEKATNPAYNFNLLLRDELTTTIPVDTMKSPLYHVIIKNELYAGSPISLSQSDYYNTNDSNNDFFTTTTMLVVTGLGLILLLVIIISIFSPKLFINCLHYFGLWKNMIINDNKSADQNHNHNQKTEYGNGANIFKNMSPEEKVKAFASTTGRVDLSSYMQGLKEGYNHSKKQNRSKKGAGLLRPEAWKKYGTERSPEKDLDHLIGRLNKRDKQDGVEHLQL